MHEIVRHPCSFAVLTLSLMLCALPATATQEISSGIPALLLIEHPGQSSLDQQIRTSQLKLKTTTLPGAELERLAWLFVAKARVSSDPGFYTVAAAAADALEQKFGMANQALLLRGHVLQTRHRFAEAEAIARKLVSGRGAAADFALLGDALYDEGRISEAAEAYQKMVDLKPSLDSYARAANIRWIKGDLTGAIEVQTLAVRAGGPGDPGASAWTFVRLAQFVWQQGNAAAATVLVQQALERAPEFQPALLLQGRLLLASGRAADALIPLARAAAILPLPEPRWVYADALRTAGREAEAIKQEKLLVAEGIAEDPRTVALFLATRGQDAPNAVQLAAAELKTRTDIMTHSAVALALATAGRIDEALVHQQAALAEGTVDARLLLHAGRVAVLARQPNASDLLNRARRLAPLLLPSERQLLDDSFRLLTASSGSADNTHNATHQKTS